ncbi:hypothetical protein AMTRI_Chr04g184160 [Amborella trichopoda]
MAAFAAAAGAGILTTPRFLPTSSQRGSFVLPQRHFPISTPQLSGALFRYLYLFPDYFFLFWDAVENKSTVILYGGGALVALWLSTVVIGAVNSVPLLPKIMELVGLGYTGWFVYRYLLFKSSRKELASDIEALKKKIAGTAE